MAKWMESTAPAYATIVTTTALVLWAAPALASMESRALTREGYRLAYGLNFSKSLAVLATARLTDRHDPAPPRAIAAVTWMEILFAQGVATFAAFDGDASADHVVRPAIPPQLRERFVRHVEEAAQLAERAIAQRPHDLDAEYQLGATRGLLALYRGTVEGQALAAFNDGRRAVATMMRIREKDPGHREAALIPGIYRYAVSTLSWPKRMLAAAIGMGGDRDGGILLLEAAAAEQADTATDAALVLMVVYNREGRHADAFRHLWQLQMRHPDNRLIRLNSAATALAASQPARAEREVTAVLALKPQFEDLRIAGERALWFYTRGAARMALRQPEAAGDLRESLSSDARHWVKAHAHMALGRIAVQSGDTKTASTELHAAIHYGHGSGEQTVAKEAKRLLRQLPDRKQSAETTGSR